MATPGPWEEKTNRHPQCNGEPWGWISGAAGNITWSGYVGKTNADFIAHARTDIPALISEVEQLEEWRTTYIRMKEQWKHDCDLLVQAGNDNAAKDQQIATLEKALELACEKIATELGYEKFEEAGINSISEGAKALMEIFTQQAKEQGVTHEK
ncbi:MAG: hypothetical protein ACLSWS_22490 [Faecalispora jeddahensis]